MHLLPSDSPPKQSRCLPTDAPFCHDYLDSIDYRSDRGLPGFEILSPLAVGYGVPWQDSWQQNPCSAETPERLWCTQGSDFTLLQQASDAPSTFHAQEPIDSML